MKYDPANPTEVACDGCVEGFVPCDIECDENCPGNHAHVLCNGTGRLDVSIRGFKDEREYDGELRRGM